MHIKHFIIGHRFLQVIHKNLKLKSCFSHCPWTDGWYYRILRFQIVLKDCIFRLQIVIWKVYYYQKNPQFLGT